MKHNLSSLDLNRDCQELCVSDASTCYENVRTCCTKRLCAEETFINEAGQTRLHLLCQETSCSVDEIRQALAIFPAALQRRDVYGRSPLFYALKCDCSFEIAILLFDSFPDAILFADFCGDTPLHLLYHWNKGYRTLEHVLTKMPSLAVHKENTFSSQPLYKRLFAPWSSKQLPMTKPDQLRSEAHQDRWMKLVLTVRAAHVHTTGEADYQPELHVALRVGCPFQVLVRFVEKYPNQASMLMMRDRCYPLHFFLSRHDVTKESQLVLQSLISAYPQALNRPCQGRLPLHVAIDSGRKWENGMEDVVFAAPNNLDSVDPRSGLMPFLQAASLPCSDLSTIYSILRENPAVLSVLQ